MKILHIASINNSPFSGVSVVVPKHINAQKRFAEVSFINVNGIKVEGIECQLEYQKGMDFSNLKGNFKRPDIVIFHEAYRKKYLEIYKRLIACKIPYVIIPHGELGEEAQHKKFIKKKVANLLLFNKFITNAAALQLLSDLECKNTHFKCKKIVETNGIDIPEVKHKLSSNPEIKFTYIGRLDLYHKGLDLMLQAINKDREFIKEKNTTIFIYGPHEEKYTNEVNNLISEYHLEEIVLFKDPVIGEEKINVLLQTDIFIQTSRFEGMPMGILEAMSYGIPCLVTEGTRIGTLIEENSAGWCVATSVDDIASGIKKCISDRFLWSKMGENAFKCVASYFAWNKVEQQTINAYNNLIS